MILYPCASDWNLCRLSTLFIARLSGTVSVCIDFLWLWRYLGERLKLFSFLTMMTLHILFNLLPMTLQMMQSEKWRYIQNCASFRVSRCHLNIQINQNSRKLRKGYFSIFSFQLTEYKFTLNAPLQKSKWNYFYLIT